MLVTVLAGVLGELADARSSVLAGVLGELADANPGPLLVSLQTVTPAT